MANNRGRSTSSGKRKATTKKRNTNSRSKKNTKQTYDAINPDVVMFISIVVGVFLFLCNINKAGDFGKVVSDISFGLFGISAYAMPFLLIALVFFGYVSRENYIVRTKLICAIFMYCFINIMFEECAGIVKELSEYSAIDIWNNCKDLHTGGGIILGSIAYIMHKYLSMPGTVFVCLIACVICILIFIGRNALEGFKENSRQIYSTAREDAAYRRQIRNEQREADRVQYEEEHRDSTNSENIVEEPYIPRYARKKRGIGNMDSAKTNDEYSGEILPEIDKTPRRDRKFNGVSQDTTLVPETKNNTSRDDMHEIMLSDEDSNAITEKAYATSAQPFDNAFDLSLNNNSQSENDYDSDSLGGSVPIIEDYVPLSKKNINSDINSEPSFESDDVISNIPTISESFSQTDVYDDDSANIRPKVKATLDKSTQGMDEISKNVTRSMNKASKKSHKKYIMPSTNLLDAPSASRGGDNNAELNDTAMRLQQTLETFGVKAKLTGCSRGPSVTRFELQPEIGVRVNKITSLQDDIKLSLAATDIRIEAPIPGKSAVGIEVPNKSSEGVGLRELLENKEFKNFESKIAFAVGKDISGKVVVTDIAKMPHMLIAGSTGSGKSVCINTIIMSILYKAHPDDVKLIMIDPKVVELKMYNGIPHLMVPVVTDPKKAAAALHWGVVEMQKRYQMFSAMNVRDLKGYNKAVEQLPPSDDPEAPKKLPQIVIIVDELADLMMVAAKEVEESICRLAQLARACGIHLIIATQRPSVDVITGLIKANMPSRVAFAVSSGTDSRTILDMNGAEKLLGKGDMLFYPQGYPKPVRVQGAFVSDSEVAKVVDFITSQDYGTEGQDELLIKMDSIASSSGSSGSASAEEDDRDELFIQAGQFIIDQDKASIGSLQRKFKIGFNRAARIMDQLTEAGVVSEEDGKKPRTVLMGPEQFEQYVEEYV